MSEMMVRALGEGDYLVPQEQGESLRERLRRADELPLEQRNAAVRDLIAEAARDGTEAPKGAAPDLVLALREPPPEPPPAPQPEPDDGTRYYRDPADPRYDVAPEADGRGVGGRPYGERMDIDDTDRWRG